MSSTSACAARAGLPSSSARSGCGRADRVGLVRHEGRIDRRRPLRIYPSPERLRRLVSPAHTQAATGSEVARLRAEGLEFADTRPFVHGDRVRSINWRATARRGALVVNERHPERNADVVIFLDSFAEARTSGEGTLEQAVRTAATLAGRFLERRDRVGLVAFGGILRWLEPGGGLVQQYRLVDALLETDVEFSYAWKDVERDPRADAAPARARRRRHPAARRAVDRARSSTCAAGATTSSCSRSRPSRTWSRVDDRSRRWRRSGYGGSSGQTCAPDSSGSGPPSPPSVTRPPSRKRWRG